MSGGDSFSLARVLQDIDAACADAGRAPDTVRLVGVSKKQPPEAIDRVVREGLSDLGESRVQEAAAKVPVCSSGITWHLIGHLQTNKARAASELFHRIHSIDSLRLLEAVESACAASGRRIDACVQVNVGGEAQKHGVRPADLDDLIEASFRCEYVTVDGLMAIPPFSEDPSAAQPYFAQLRDIRDGLETSTGARLPELSMGMSRDFAYAIAEGATLLRIGTAVFGPRAGVQKA